MSEENQLLFEHNVLYMPEEMKSERQQYIAKHFPGFVRDTAAKLCELLSSLDATHKRMVYLTGDLTTLATTMPCRANNVINIVKEYATNYEPLLAQHQCVFIDRGRIPVNVFGVGVLFRRFFDPRVNFFRQIASEHKFQSLTESNKAGTAFRKGIYLTNVVKKQDGDITFNLLRCSSNLQGPTDNFGPTDRKVIEQVNNVVQRMFARPVDMNHVLAQIYYNNRDADTSKETKAKIKAHSDKTKDMPAWGLIAFASFYDLTPEMAASTDDCGIDQDEGQGQEDEFDLRYQRKTSVLTTLQFVLKFPEKHPTLEKSFRVLLYPNSLFVISLETNRLYTHEIKPSSLPVDKIPTRMGYVIRCSKTKAVRMGDETYIIDGDGQERFLGEMNEKDMDAIKSLYWQENSTEDRIVYPLFFTSLNDGDYLEPLNPTQ